MDTLIGKPIFQGRTVIGYVKKTEESRVHMQILKEFEEQVTKNPTVEYLLCGNYVAVVPKEQS